MADIHGSPAADAGQLPAASNAGPAPVPYQGADQSPEPPDYSLGITGFLQVGDDVMSGVTGAMGVQESGYAHDMNAGLVTPYVTAPIKVIYTGTTGAAGDDVSTTVAGAVTAAEARFDYHLQDILPAGADYGEMMNLPENSMDPAVGVQGAEGSYFDPPRDY